MGQTVKVTRNQAVRCKCDHPVVGKIHGLDPKLGCRLSDEHIAVGVCSQRVGDLIDLPAGIRQWRQDRQTDTGLFLDLLRFFKPPQPYRQTTQSQGRGTIFSDFAMI